MRKFLRFSLVCALAMVCGSMFAQEVILNFDEDDNKWGLPENSANKTAEEKSFTNGSYTIKLIGSEGNGYYWHAKDKYLMLGKQGAKLTLPAFSFDVEKIEVTGTSGASAAVKQNIYVGDNAVSTETTGMKGVTQAYEIASNYQNSGTIYSIQVTSNHNTQIKEIKIYKKGSGGGTISVAPPTIDGNSQFEESVETTIKAEGYTIYYTTDGSTPDETSKSGKNSITLTITEKTTVKAIATDGQGHWSIVTTKTFTKKEGATDTPSSEISVATALEKINALGTEKTAYVDNEAIFRVKGYVVGTPDWQRKNGELYGNVEFKIADEKGGTNLLTVYHCNNIDNAKYTEETINNFKEGDLVVVEGKLQVYVKNGNSTAEISSCHLISINGSTEGSTTEPQPSQTTEVNVATALEKINALGTEKTAYVDNKANFEVKGYIVDISEIMADNGNGGKYGNATFTIADTKGGSPVLTVFRCKDIENKDFTDENKIKVGDLVVVKGVLQIFVKDGNATPEVSSCYLVSINGDTTGINNATAEKAENAPAYNIAGQKVGANYKGIVIKNGKKVIKK